MSNTVAARPHSPGVSPPDRYADRYPKLVSLAGDAGLQAAIAANPGAGAETLRMLAVNSDVDVRVALAGNPSTPPDVLRTLITPVREANLDVLGAVAGNAKAPQRAFDDIINEVRHEKVLVRFADNDAVPAEQVMRLQYHFDGDVRKAAAARAVRESLAAATRPLSTVRYLSRWPRPYLRAAAASRSCPPEILRNLVFRSADVQVLMSVAANPVTGASTLTALAGYPNRDVRCAVAGNEAVAAYEAVMKLRSDEDPAVRFAAAKWTHWTARDLQTFPDDMINAVASHPEVGEDFLRHIAEDDKVGALAESIASNPSAPLDMLHDIASTAATGGHSRTLWALAANPAVGRLFAPGDLYSDPRGSLTL